MGSRPLHHTKHSYNYVLRIFTKRNQKWLCHLFQTKPIFFDLFLGTNGANGANAGPTAEDGSCRNPAMCLGKNSINFTLLAYYRNTTVL